MPEGWCRAGTIELAIGGSDLRAERAAETALALVSVAPEAASLPDTSSGMLPLHFAARSGASTELVNALIAAYPEGVFTADMSGLCALHWAVAAGAKPPIVSALLMADRGELLREIVQFQELAEVVFDVVRRFPHSARGSVFEDGRSAADIAVGFCRTRLREALYLIGRYELREPAVHVSATCEVYEAHDHSDSRKQRVALKVMRNKEQFDREVAMREGGRGEAAGQSGEEGAAAGCSWQPLGSAYVLPILRTHTLHEWCVGPCGSRHTPQSASVVSFGNDC